MRSRTMVRRLGPIVVVGLAVLGFARRGHAADECRILALDGGRVVIGGPGGGVSGDVCIGPTGRLTLSGTQVVDGRVRLAPGATLTRGLAAWVAVVCRCFSACFRSESA